MPYEYLDEITSDVKFQVKGEDLKEILVDSALALCNIMYETKNVENKGKIEIKVEADNEKMLLYKWLSEVLAQGEIKNMFFSEFEIVKLENNSITAMAHGNKANPELLQTIVKGVTLHDFYLEKTNEGYIARVVVDI